jgi:hypothetical protein
VSLSLVLINFTYVGATYQHVLSDIFANGTTVQPNLNLNVCISPGKKPFCLLRLCFGLGTKTNLIQTTLQLIGKQICRRVFYQKKIVLQNPNVIFNVFCFLFKSKRHG